MLKDEVYKTEDIRMKEKLEANKPAKTENPPPATEEEKEVVKAQAEMKKEADELEKTDEKKAEERQEEAIKNLPLEAGEKKMKTVEEHKWEQWDKTQGTPHQEVMKIKDALDLTRDEAWTLKMKKSIINGEMPDGDPKTLAQKE
jgi:hypothetical protein